MITCRRRPKPGATYTGRWLTEDPRDCFACGLSCMLAITPIGDESDDVADEDIYSVEARIEDGRVKDAARRQAGAARQQADAAWQQADAAWQQADAAWQQLWRWAKACWSMMEHHKG